MKVETIFRKKKNRKKKFKDLLCFAKYNRKSYMVLQNIRTKEESKIFKFSISMSRKIGI
jgi:hypothetical protein